MLVLPECLNQLDVALQDLLRLQALDTTFDTVGWISTGCDVGEATPWSTGNSCVAPHVVPLVEIRLTHLDQAVNMLPIGRIPPRQRNTNDDGASLGHDLAKMAVWEATELDEHRLRGHWGMKMAASTTLSRAKSI